MIVVDALRQCGAPWGGGVACHLVSDQSVLELHAFAERIGCPRWWFQGSAFPHYDLAPKFRARAIAAGAAPLGREEFVAAMRRFRSREASRRAEAL